MKLKSWQSLVVVTGALGVAAITPAAFASSGSGVTPKTLATARLETTVRVHEDGIRFRTRGATNVSVQNLVFAPGARTGWHHHPGMVLVAVQDGAVTAWDSDCNSVTYGPGLPAGSAFTESGDEPLEVTSAEGATVYATLIVPQVDPPVFRVEDSPPACASSRAGDPAS